MTVPQIFRAARNVASLTQRRLLRGQLDKATGLARLSDELRDSALRTFDRIAPTNLKR